jgi:hypothetical protein
LSQITVPSKKLFGSASILLVAGSCGLVFSQFLAFSLFLIVLGGFFLGAGFLVRRSLALTAAASVPQSLHELLKAKKHQVNQTKYYAQAPELGESLADQLKDLTGRVETLERVLKEKFDPSEITFSRYSDAIGQMTLAVVANIDQSMLLLKSLESMNPLDPTRASNIQAARDEVVQLSDFNGRAILQLDQLSTSLQQINHGESRISAIEESLEQVKLLADRANKYSR